MKKMDKYKAQIDSISFREGFEDDIIRIMRRAAETKEEKVMSKKKTIRIAVIAAIVIAMFTTTVFALPLLLSPKEVANRAGEYSVAQAFESADAIAVNKSITADGYCITLHGMVAGKKLVSINEELREEDRSYVVISVARTDGTPITNDDELFQISPLVSGYETWIVNAWSLGTSATGIYDNGVVYYLFDYASLEIFADRTVYIAVYEGHLAPSPEIFSNNADGSISYRDDYKGIRGMFTLPLDPEKADPDAAAKLLEEYYG